MSIEHEEQLNEQRVAPPPGPKARLSGRVEEEVGRSFAEGNADEGTRILQENGFSPTDIVRLASHYSRELEESILRIAWNKKRLTYATAILEHTLAGENKKVASAENLIKNYLIFNKIFQGKEGKLPRFGQFAYVMRSIFKGVATNDDIYDCIANHKTFGEGVALNREEIDALSDEIEQLSQEVEKNFKEAAEKRKILEGSMAEAKKEEEQEKGTVWTPAYSEPNEYFFPNYTFQTGTRKGLNHAPGRSSWEPMFLAYADVVNKRMEDRILSRTNMNEEEKRERVARYRIELLYEPFDFPVDIKTANNGVERPVIYRLDFIDINRWRAIEVKGPLTPKGAEKIKLFQKYYVDGDFSDLPKDKRILMMSYVQDKKDEIARWCEERGYPVFDHFSSLSVLGAWKWDPAINNFNRYSRAKDMPGLTERQIEQLQKGFFKMVEERIEVGKTPDIRPEGYQRSDGILKLAKSNEKEAGRKKIPYEINKPSSTKPYIPDAIAEDVYKTYGKGQQTIYLPAALKQEILETIPISRDKKETLSSVFRSLEVVEILSDFLNESISKRVSKRDMNDVIEGNSVIRLIPSEITREDYEGMVSGLEIFRNYLLDMQKNKIKVDKASLGPEHATGYIKNLITILKKTLSPTGYELIVNKGMLELSSKLNKAIFEDGQKELRDIITYYNGFLLGEHKQVFDERFFEMESFLADNYQLVSSSEEELLKILKKNTNIGGKIIYDSSAASSLMHLMFHKEKAPGRLMPAFAIANSNFSSIDMRPMKFYEFAKIAEKKYKGIRGVVKHLVSLKKNDYTENEYLDTLKRMDLSSNWTNDLADDFQDFRDFLREKEKIIVSMAEILLIDEIGVEKYNRLNERFDDYFSRA